VPFHSLASRLRERQARGDPPAQVCLLVVDVGREPDAGAASRGIIRGDAAGVCQKGEPVHRQSQKLLQQVLPVQGQARPAN